VATAVLLLAPLAVAFAAYLAFASDDAGGGAGGLPIATHTPPVPHRAEADPRYHGKPVPGIDLKGVDAFHLALGKPPRGGLVFDVDSGDVLWREDPLRVLPIASLTKIMTALIVVDRTRPNEPVRITQAALDYQGSGVGLLPKGKRVRAEALLNGLLIVSGNDAAIALAVHISGNERRFAALMNKRARAWGLTCTHFVSSHGLEPGNRSCARDLAVLTRLAMSKPRIRRIVRLSQAEMKFPIKGGKLYLSGHNPLIRAGYPGTIGLKTGYTDEAGRCFVGVVRRGGHRLGVVLLNSFDPAKQGEKLLDAAFAAAAAG
jgi:D-alanyl-D-alanine carboxypeptidase